MHITVHTSSLLFLLVTIVNHINNLVRYDSLRSAIDSIRNKSVTKFYQRYILVLGQVASLNDSAVFAITESGSSVCLRRQNFAQSNVGAQSINFGTAISKFDVTSNSYNYI